MFSSENFYQILGEDENAKIIYNSYSAKEELQLSYNQILFYGKADPEIAKTVLNSIYMVYLVADKSVHREIEMFFSYCYNLCKEAMDNQSYIDQLDEIYKDFEQKKDDSMDRDINKEE